MMAIQQRLEKRLSAILHVGPQGRTSTGFRHKDQTNIADAARIGQPGFQSANRLEHLAQSVELSRINGPAGIGRLAEYCTSAVGQGNSCFQLHNGWWLLIKPVPATAKFKTWQSARRHDLQGFA